MKIGKMENSFVECLVCMTKKVINKKNRMTLIKNNKSEHIVTGI